MSVKPTEFRIVACQMTSIDNLQANENQAWTLIQQIKNPGDVELISFPENSLFMRLRDGEAVEGVDLQDKIFDRLAKFARENKTTIHLGSVPLKAGPKVYNATVILDSLGGRSSPYHKIHLFDVDIAGHRSYRESDTVKAGEKPAIIDVDGWKIGLSICYDLRFSNLYEFYARNDVDVILIPSAFTVPTGQAHWEPLLRARAIESQCYVVAAAQQGHHSDKRETFGHTMIVDPWGQVLGVIHAGIGVLDFTLTQERLDQVRAQIPMAHHRRDPFR